ncbi:hypothetical protein APS56_01075 [Pseudalgibacter alginicilyticus]|uniref:DUF2007 domain-containing protein n=1 Tax=Pseudalgibacter alginicilyticus TaxID=1736674 RepID=A0A0P0CM53_9FLAO|nr:DUF2007 domain-containing protein [Pseudalgibacter alginicilyticus]ALJ03826.1 hypothetical protein APS56_01075 [Pseudalgibacter alginicilyticus]
MNDSNYTIIYSGNLIIAQRIVSELKKANIHAIVKEQTESGLLIPVFGGSNSDYQELFVHKDELDKALPIVKNITSELQKD